MARLPRLSVAGQPHLVLQSGRRGESLFCDDDDRRCYLDALRIAARDVGSAVHGYALMNDRIYLLLTPPRSDSLGRLMQKVGRRYVTYFNRRHQRVGTLWDGRYRAAVVEPERFLLNCLRHLESGPVRDDLVRRPQDWPWSSAAHHVGRIDDPLVTEHSMYWQLGNTPFARQAAYLALNEEPLPADKVAAIDHAVSGGWALGSPEYLAELTQNTNRRLKPRSPGRKRALST